MLTYQLHRFYSKPFSEKKIPRKLNLFRIMTRTDDGIGRKLIIGSLGRGGVLTRSSLERVEAKRFINL